MRGDGRGRAGENTFLSTEDTEGHGELLWVGEGRGGRGEHLDRLLGRARGEDAGPIGAGGEIEEGEDVAGIGLAGLMRLGGGLCGLFPFGLFLSLDGRRLRVQRGAALFFAVLRAVEKVQHHTSLFFFFP